MFAAAAVFAVGVGGMGGCLALGARESKRIVETGQQTRVVVLSKDVDARKKNHWIEVRPEESPDVAPFRRILRPGDWDLVKPGDRLGYFYEPAWPQHGVIDLEIPMRTDVALWFLLGSFFVWPFLAAGAFLKVRERRKGAAG
jgi:hypothetical protein